MKRLIPLLLLVLAVSGCGLLQDTFSEETTTDSPPALRLLGDTPTPMDIGSYCWAGICADAIPPSYTQDQHIIITDTSIQLRFTNTPPNSVNAYVHPGSNLMTRIADIQLEPTLDDNTITIILPDDLVGDFVLVVFGSWQDSVGIDASYTLPITIQ